MSRRLLMLEEMGLAPVWRVRPGTQASAAAAPPIASAGRTQPAASDAAPGALALTLRLADCPPADVLERYATLAADERAERIEAWLDGGHGECWLRSDAVAEAVRDALLAGGQALYRLHAWVIMPNHLHVVAEPVAAEVAAVIDDIAARTGEAAAAALGRAGPFWDASRIARPLRDANALAEAAAYAVGNPVRAGLARSPAAFRFSSAFVADLDAAPASGRARTRRPAPSPSVPAARDLPVPPAPAADERREAILRMDWPALEACIADCTACPLHERRTLTVPGVGDRRAQWMFVGEGPGAEEDLKGEPFVGQAGRLLDNMLATIGLARGNGVYIANVVKCRPPGNRNPETDEMNRCEPFLTRQIELVGPRLIVAMGRIAATHLLATNASIASLRGRLHDYRGTPLIVTYHPAYLLRNLPDKAKAWADLCFAVETMRSLQAAASAG